MANIRMLPSPVVARQTITANGRKYTCAIASFLDVPDFDAVVLRANGWIDCGTSGATTARPTNPSATSVYFDTTLGLTIRFDGKTWRNPVSGAAV